MKKITVFTPTYNRRELLVRLYNSLRKQTDYDFIWLVIDDGSTDDTRNYIESLKKKETKFEIQYFYKENGGLHTGYNEAFKHISTEYCLCCDSDDWLPSNCIEIIKNNLCFASKKMCAGILGLDFYKTGEIVGEKIPFDKQYVDLNELFIKGKLIGDKKLIVKSKLYKELEPIKTINNEKNFNPNYYNVVLSEKYQWYAINENLCFVEYQAEGMSNGIYKQYINSPNSFIELRKLYLSLKRATFGFKCRHIIHYDAECFLAKRVKNIFLDSPHLLLSVVLMPFGFCLYMYILRKGR